MWRAPANVRLKMPIIADFSAFLIVAQMSTIADSSARPAAQENFETSMLLSPLPTAEDYEKIPILHFKQRFGSR
jgi:hypothetical protein